jgi:hypothetical protein
MRGVAVQTFFFDMKDGVPLRDRIGIEFNTNLEAIEHSHVLAQHFRDDSLTDDQDLEISVVNALGREIHREFVHRDQADPIRRNSAPPGKVDRLG